MTCQHEGCTSTLVVDCIRPELIEIADRVNSFDKETWQQLEQEYIEYFCPRHCRQHGYCWNCGFAQQNLTNMDGNGMCKFCNRP